MAPVVVENQGMEILAKYHPDLSAVGVTIDFVFGYAAEDEEGQKKGVALKEHGYPTTGISSVASLKNRVKGMKDCEILLDGDRWSSFSTAQQDAILDHQLSHFVVSRNIEGEAIYDANDRPKMKLQLHSFQAGWFHEVAKRHGADSTEMAQAAKLFQSAGQVYFPFVSTAESIKPLKVLKPAAKPKAEKVKKGENLVEVFAKESGSEMIAEYSMPEEPIEISGTEPLDPDQE